MKLLYAFPKAFRDYIPLILLNYLFLLIIRLWGWVAGSSPFADMLQGLLGDAIVVNTALVLLYLPFWLLWFWKSRLAIFAGAGFWLLVHAFSVPVVECGQRGIDGINAVMHGCSMMAAWQACVQSISPVGWLVVVVLLAGAAALVLWWHLSRNIRFPGWFAFLLAVALPLSAPLAFEPGLQPGVPGSSGHVHNPAYELFLSGYRCMRGQMEQETIEVSAREVIRATRPHSETLHTDEYPLLHSRVPHTCLADFINPSAEPPHIVILIVQGLSQHFLEPVHGHHFMPFLTELSQQSLYWPHFLATSSRHQNMPASLLGGLPPTREGFANIPHIPYHFSLVNVLNHNGYHTAYHSGQWAWFNGTDRLLHHNNIGSMRDAGSFPEQFSRVITGDDNYFWGYNDQDLFQWYLQYTAPGPRLDIIQTGSTHSPFAIERKEEYAQRIAAMELTSAQREQVEQHLEAYQSLLFADDALRSFWETMRREPRFSNTLFLITGNYPMAELAPSGPLHRYNVPLLLWAPWLKSPHTFEQIASHYDIYESLTTLLGQQYQLDIPSWSISPGVHLCREQDSRLLIPLVNQGNEVNEILWGNHFLNQSGELFEVGPALAVTPADNPQKASAMASLLDIYRQNNALAASQVMPDSLYFQFMGYKVLVDTLLPQQRVRTEYRNIFSDLPLGEGTHILDISLSRPDIALDEVYIVYELRDANDSILRWKNFGVPVGKTDFSIRIRLDQELTEGRDARLAVFLWNESPVPYSFGSARTVLYKAPRE
mgnify:CR=1 FL=1